MAEPTLYLFDGFNLLHAGGFGSPEELRDLLASWVAAQGARGVLVFDGQGSNERHGPLEVRWAKDADALLERLAAEHRNREQVAIVSSDAAVRGTTATGRCSTAPADARQTAAVTRAEPCAGTTTPLPPAPSALRITAPRFRGSLTWSRHARSGAGRAASSNAST